MPISVSISTMIQFVIQFAIFLLFYFYHKIFLEFDIQLSMFVLFTPFILVHMAILSVGLGLIISSATAKYRDLTFAMGFFVQLWMYLTPIVYPLSSVPEKYQTLILVNPMTAIVESFRFSYLGVSSLTLDGLMLSIIISFFLFFIGLLLFNIFEKTFMDTV